MPGFLLHTGAAMQCTHAALVAIPPAQPRVLVSGMPVATLAAKITVAPGCPFTIPGPKPQPCMTVTWMLPAARVKVVGVPALLQPGPGVGIGLCLSAEQLPNGQPFVSFVQARVLAT
jgi:hypothetical protein